MALFDLPVEILVDIIHLVLQNESSPSNILRVCKGFHGIGQPVLSLDLRFRSSTQLVLFSQAQGRRLGLPPRSMTVDLTGRSADFRVFRYLRDALLRCRGEFDKHGPIAFNTFCLRLHSYAQDTSLQFLEECLSFIDPRSFIWTGPDPEHHFSTAIVAPFSSRLFEAFGAWSNIRHIKVTNIAFSYFHASLRSPLLPDIPSLRTLYIGQATFLAPQSITAIFFENIMTNLESIRLVDAYGGSIWGPRIRRSDLENVAALILSESGSVDDGAILDRIRRIVFCEKKTERIMGGDRVEGGIFLL
ncbi:hypothetical protein BJ138DRAFT_1083491 [Hygrophoropsis aurantiaca]|uniref:Uncharacterized protein n=1 Tax=Hygrophoropsis aurantiaca TaxID=72124 RepID=A0ACB8AHW0_9AGAM|nr:hypothetical protein BJ138DRAFT_1083491 [Hygrophoropsis aurantiaca]